MANNLDKQYTALLQDILDNGLFGRQIRHKMSDGFPLLTTKKLHWKSIVGELLWFLRGDTNIKWLVDNQINIWNGDAYKKYYNDKDTFGPLTMAQFIEEIKTDDEFAKKWGDLGPIYGRAWRNWGSEEILVEKSFGDDEGFGYKRKVKEQTKGIDQIANLINDLKTNPDSRRLMVNAWNVGELDSMVLPPCHYSWQVYTRELSIEERLDLASKTYSVFDPFDFYECTHDEIDKLYPVPKRAISLMWNQRSVDTGLGLGFNIASYGLLLEIIAKEVNMVPDELIGNLGDVHLYLDHVEPIKEQLNREPYPLPKLGKLPDYLCKKDNWECYKPSDITIENYQSHPTIKLPLSN